MCPQQPVQVVLIVLLILRVEAAYMHETERMDELLVAEIDTHMAYMGLACFLITRAEEHQVAGHKVAEVGGYLQMFAFVSLL